MIIDLCNDDIDQRKCPKPIPHKSRGVHTQIWSKIIKIEISKALQNALELVQVVSRSCYNIIREHLL